MTVEPLDKDDILLWPGIGWGIALYAVPAARNSTILISIFLVCSTSAFLYSWLIGVVYQGYPSFGSRIRIALLLNNFGLRITIALFNYCQIVSDQG